jgi:NCAIR mutase (PurE)-related protein
MKPIIFLLCISGIFTLSVSADEWEQKFRSNQEKFHQQTREIHESIRGGNLSHEEGQEKLAKIRLEHAEKSKKMHWNRMERKIESEVISGRMSREMADEKYRQVKESMERKDEVVHELESEIKDSLNELREAVQAGEISEEEARMEGQEIRAHLHHEIRMAHMEIDLDAEEARLGQGGRGG